MSEAKLNLPPELQRILKYWRLIISLLSTLNDLGFYYFDSISYKNKFG